MGRHHARMSFGARAAAAAAGLVLVAPVVWAGGAGAATASAASAPAVTVVTRAPLPLLAAAATASARVRVPLKAAWKVVRPAQLALADGAMTCRVTKLVRSGSKPATAADVACSVPAAQGNRTYRLVVTVKGVRGARVATSVAFRAAPSGGGLLRGALQQVDLSTTGRGSDAGTTPNSALSPDGRYVAFWADATNLVPGATDGLPHVYVADVSTGRVVTMGDISQGGALSNDPSSAKGSRGLAWHPGSRRLLFSSNATNLGPTPPEVPGPWLYEVDLVSLAVTVYPVGGVDQVQYSPDGSAILFETDLRYGTDGNNDGDLWMLPVADPSSIFGVSTTAGGAFPPSGAGPTASYNGVWSPDGTRIAFQTYAPLVPEDSNRVMDVYVKDLRSGAVSRASVSASGSQANGQSENPAWSPDGTRIAFDSDADNLVPGDGNSSSDVFVKTLAGGAVQAASTKATGQFAVFDSRAPKWAPDGVRLSFSSSTIELMTGVVDANTREDVYVKNLRTGLVQLASVRADGRQGTGASSQNTVYGPRSAAWLPDGHGMLFHSRATNFSDTDGNAFNESLFIKRL